MCISTTGNTEFVEDNANTGKMLDKHLSDISIYPLQVGLVMRLSPGQDLIRR